MGKKMIVGIQGTSGFSDYMVFLRSMAVAMASMKNEDNVLSIYTAGPSNINAMVSEFTNLSERGFKSRGKKINMHKVAPSWIQENMSDINYFAFLNGSGEQQSKLVLEAKKQGVEYGIFQY
jgi:hypothetical protein